MTIQIKDTLIMNGERICITGTNEIPFDEYLFFKVKPSVCLDIFSSSACHRGYTADYLLSHGFIYLAGLNGCIGVKRGKLLKADWLNCDIETSYGLVTRVQYGRVVKQFYRPYEQEPPIVELGLLGRLRSWLKTQKPKSDITPINKRRLELLRYRKALLQIRIEKYLSGSKFYRFASVRLENTERNIKRLTYRGCNDKVA